MENLDNTTTCIDVTGIAKKFISERIHDDGNVLTDSIYKLDDRRFFHLRMNYVEPGRHAFIQLRENMQLFLSMISAVAEEAVKAFSLKEKEILHELKSLMDKCRAENDPEILSHLVEFFNDTFMSTKHQLEYEITQHEDEYNWIMRRLDCCLNDIEKASSSLFLFGNKRREQEELINVYIETVGSGSDTRQTLTSTILELARKKEAVKVCDAMTNLVDSYRLRTYEASFPEQTDAGNDRIKELRAEKEAAKKHLAQKQSQLESMERHSLDHSQRGSTLRYMNNPADQTPEHYRNEITKIQEHINALEKEIAAENTLSTDNVYSTVFAPAEVKRKSNMMTQVYLHLAEESKAIMTLSCAADKKAEVRNFTPLSINLRYGEKVDVELNIYGSELLMSERKSLIWMGTFSKCAFRYFVPEDIDVEELYCEVNIIIRQVMIGEMAFTTQIVENPRNLAPEIFSHKFNKIFISYAREDQQIANTLAFAYKVQDMDYFFDKETLKSGDVYDEQIMEYIDSADLFILCWSKHAAESEYVTKERHRAMQHAYPQISRDKATLKICPICIPPQAELPEDMIKIYNFSKLE